MPPGHEPSFAIRRENARAEHREENVASPRAEFKVVELGGENGLDVFGVVGDNVGLAQDGLPVRRMPGTLLQLADLLRHLVLLVGLGQSHENIDPARISGLVCRASLAPARPGLSSMASRGQEPIETGIEDQHGDEDESNMAEGCHLYHHAGFKKVQLIKINVESWRREKSGGRKPCFLSKKLSTGFHEPLLGTALPCAYVVNHAGELTMLTVKRGGLGALFHAIDVVWGSLASEWGLGIRDTTAFQLQYEVCEIRHDDRHYLYRNKP